MTFMYECDRPSTDQGSELLKDSVSFRLYHSMFIAHDEWQELITQTSICNHNTEEYCFPWKLGKLTCMRKQCVYQAFSCPNFRRPGYEASVCVCSKEKNESKTNIHGPPSMAMNSHLSHRRGKVIAVYHCST